MRVFITCETLSEETAQSTQLTELAENMERAGQDVTIFAPGTRRYKGAKKIKAVYVPVLDFFIFRSITYQLLLFAYLIMYSSKYKPDVLYTRMGVFSIAPLAVSRLFGRPHVIHFPDNIAEDMDMDGTNKAFISCYKSIEKLNCTCSQAITTPTEGIKRYLADRYQLPEDKVTVLPNGANVELLRPMNKERCREELGLKPGSYVGFVGGLAAWQGLEYLIWAAPKILEADPATYFLIVGGGPLAEDLKKRADEAKVAERFIFTGTVPYSKVPAYINSMDVCVALKRPMSSGYSPLKLYEYLSCEKPVVASDLPGFELLKEQKAGILVRPGDVNEISKAITLLLGDPGLRDEMGKAGRRYVEENHSWKAAAERSIVIFSSHSNAR